MPDPSSTATDSKAPLLEQIGRFSTIFWIANWMELVERFAYYGVRVVLPVFMVAAFEQGGPEFTHIQKGTIYAIWALVQSFVPIFTGGFADRYGYKLNIAISTVLKIIGYMLMGYCIMIAEDLAGMTLSEARPLGADQTYEIFFAGAMFLALGTAIFKPGLQGLIANQMPKENAALGWGMFYQMVNIGGFIGPMVAGVLRVLDWSHVFLACAIGISLNFIPLFFFKEPKHHGDDNDERGIGTVLLQAVRGLLEPRLFFFTIAFAGFWLMFYQLFDILPNFIDDWIDSRSAANLLKGSIEGIPPVPHTRNCHSYGWGHHLHDQTRQPQPNGGKGKYCLVGCSGIGLCNALSMAGNVRKSRTRLDRTNRWWRQPDSGMDAQLQRLADQHLRLCDGLYYRQGARPECNHCRYSHIRSSDLRTGNEHEWLVDFGNDWSVLNG